MIINNLEKIVNLIENEQFRIPNPRGKIAYDPRRVHVPNFVAIYGRPRSGKTSLSRMLSKSSGIIHLATDPIFSSHVAPCLTHWDQFLANRDHESEHFGVDRYVDSNQYDHSLFIACLIDELRRGLKQSPETHTVLLDGYVLKHYKQIFIDLDLPPERTLALQASIVNGSHMVEEIDVTGYRYDLILKHIQESFLAKCSNTTLPKSRYQNFKSLSLSRADSANTDSDTEAKYSASHLDDVVNASSRFVDIGCNAGYFCFRVANKTNGSVTGVDMAGHWLEIASHINNSIFLRDNIEFFQAEALEVLSENPDSFEIIHCASTYHYFQERQIGFLREARRALTTNGILVLEIELGDTGTEPETTKRSRGVDSSPCSFPNRAMFLQQITGLFWIEKEFESVFQKGSLYNRFYFHLRPIQLDPRIVLDRAQDNKISGWAIYSQAPERVAKLLIKINDSKEFVVLANSFRQDLLDKGFHPTGDCGFALTLPATDVLSPGDTVSVSTVGGVNLKNCPSITIAHQ